jgi:hypothetical protein
MVKSYLMEDKDDRQVHFGRRLGKLICLSIGNDRMPAYGYVKKGLR